MNKNHITAAIIFIFFILFTLFISINSKHNTVLNVISPDKLEISRQDRKTTSSEIVCLDGIEVFSLYPTDEFINKYSKTLKISKSDIISLGYLAQEYAQKSMTNKKVTVVFTPKASSHCKYAQIKYNGMLYSNILANNGFGIINGEIKNSKKFNKNLEQARKLNLVILNHHSDKYHTLDCPYGNIAHDSILIPLKQIPKSSKPCKFCHNINLQLKHKNNKELDIFNNIRIIAPPLKITEGIIKIIITDYTNNLKPNTNCETQVCKEFVNLINSSKKSIDIAAYGYDNIPKITSALTLAKARGVKIRYVYDGTYNSLNDHYKDNYIITQLADSSKSDKTNSESQSNMIMHNKFIIFDNKTVFTGSLNLSRSGLSDYDINDIIILNSVEIANLYQQEFEQMLTGKFHKAKIKIANQRKFIIGNSIIEIYFSPKDHTDERIIELINNAHQYIYAPTFLITHKGIAEALIRAKHRGIDVRIIIDANSINTRNSKHKILRSNNILLKTENYAGKLHSKSMIIDDKYLITGSMNFSNSGVNKNDENTLIIENNVIARIHKNFFLYLWTLIPNKYLKHNARPEAPESIGSCFDGVDNNFNGKIDKEEEACSKNK
jgi:phosphatidylserine/phosphatidylglycerophosphate/cardiolipin synthase-like enzyme